MIVGKNIKKRCVEALLSNTENFSIQIYLAIMLIDVMIKNNGVLMEVNISNVLSVLWR